MYQYILRLDRQKTKLTVPSSIKSQRQSLTWRTVKIFRISLRVENGVSSSKGARYAKLQAPAGAVRNVKFVDDEFLMLAFVGHGGKRFPLHTSTAANVYTTGAPRLLQIDYRPRGETSNGLLYREVDSTRQPAGQQEDSESINLTRSSDIAIHTVHTFPTAKVWAPQRLEINGRKGRRTVCVLAEDRLHYRQFDIDKLDSAMN